MVASIMDGSTFRVSAEEITRATLTDDPRIARSQHRTVFEAAAATRKMSIWERDEATKSALKPSFERLYHALQGSDIDTTSHIYLTNSGLAFRIPEPIVALGLDGEVRLMAEVYHRLNKSAEFEVRPTTVLNLEEHDHTNPVLSVSWGGHGLIVRMGNKIKTQLHEGDFGFLHEDLLHESPEPVIFQKRLVMVAKNTGAPLLVLGHKTIHHAFMSAMVIENVFSFPCHCEECG